jgi:hypothetical protein
MRRPKFKGYHFRTGSSAQIFYDTLGLNDFSRQEELGYPRINVPGAAASCFGRHRSYGSGRGAGNLEAPNWNGI